jgi:hypothetical protein
MDLYLADLEVQLSAARALDAFVSLSISKAHEDELAPPLPESCRGAESAHRIEFRKAEARRIETLARTEFIKAGAPTRILAAMERHAGDPEVLTELCCFAVASVINNVPAHTEACGTASAQRILDAMFQHIDHVHLWFCHSVAWREKGA